MGGAWTVGATVAPEYAGKDVGGGVATGEQLDDPAIRNFGDSAYQ